jgi:hypothetical protein
VNVGQPFTATGTVSPAHAGHIIYLQFQTPAGHWAPFASGIVGPGGSYALQGSFGRAATYTVRVRIFGGPENLGAASQTQTITVSGLPASSSLPAAG